MAGSFCPRHTWAVYLGVVIGQLVYMFSLLHVGPLIVIGIPFMFGYGALALVGALLGATMRRVMNEYLSDANKSA